MPEIKKYRPQQPSEGYFPEKTACDHGEGVGDPHVSFAQPKLQKQPAVEGGKDKKCIRKGCPFWPQGAQKTVYRA